MTENVTRCDLCKEPAQQKCGGCFVTFYCSKEHQKIGWKTHKKTCRPFKLGEDEKFGRYLIASKDVQEGGLIFKEQPLICGPRQMTQPVCMGCGKIVNAKTVYPCPKCGWPLCGQKCANNPNHVPECYYTCQKGEKVSVTNFDMIHPLYQCITVLRCLYQKQFAPEVWTKIEKLESHCAERKNTENYENDQIYVAKFIRNFFNLDHVFNDEEILKICGIITINGHVTPQNISLNIPPQVVIFHIASMLEHNCRANCYKTFTPEGHIKIIAGVPIKKGEHLSICYTEPLFSTPNRLKYLQNTKFFSCDCSRCNDITEFQTYCSAIKCQNKSCEGLVLPKSFLTNQNSEWTCDSCANLTTPDVVENTLKRIGQDLISMVKDNARACMKFLKHYAHVLPENHSHFLEVKLVLIQLIEGDFQLKRELCRSLLDVIKIIAPAEKRLLGVLLMELYSAEERTDEFPPLEILIEAANCLKHESSSSPEGQLYQRARGILRLKGYKSKFE